MTSNKLTESVVRRLEPKERIYKRFDGGGLYIEVHPSGSKYWRLKYRVHGRDRRLGIGVYTEVSLKEARVARSDAKALLRNDIDPLVHRRAKRDAAENTFGAIANEWLDRERDHWTIGYTERVESRINRFLAPLKPRPVNDITVTELWKILERIQDRGTIETARRVKSIVRAILDLAVATERAERNVALSLRRVLKPSPKRHFPAITDPVQLGAVLAAFDEYEASTPTVRIGLRLLPHIFVRPGELRHMEWQEIDFDESLWSIPAAKMKMKEPHTVPLSRRVVSLLEELRPYTERSQYVFPSARSVKRPMSDAALTAAIRRMGIGKDELTPHGFRATARTLLDEVLGYRVDWIEHQLAHAVRDANGRAYNRTRYLEQRKAMMQKWSDYLDGLIANHLRAGRVDSAQVG